MVLNSNMWCLTHCPISTTHTPKHLFLTRPEAFLAIFSFSNEQALALFHFVKAFKFKLYSSGRQLFVLWASLCGARDQTQTSCKQNTNPCSSLLNSISLACGRTVFLREKRGHRGTKEQSSLEILFIPHPNWATGKMTFSAASHHAHDLCSPCPHCERLLSQGYSPTQQPSE